MFQENFSCNCANLQSVDGAAKDPQIDVSLTMKERNRQRASVAVQTEMSVADKATGFDTDYHHHHQQQQLQQQEQQQREQEQSLLLDQLRCKLEQLKLSEDAVRGERDLNALMLVSMSSL